MAKAKCGGIERFRDVNKYQPPQGPTSIGNRKVGLGGVNYGNCGTQGPESIMRNTSGRVGLGGENRGKGENRKG